MVEYQTLLTEATKQGLWAILYVTLFIYTLKESRRQQVIAKEREERLRAEYQELRKEGRDRENKLTDFINDISRQFERLANQYERISDDVQDIKVELGNKQDKNKDKKGDD